MLSLLYRILTDLGAPFISLYLKRRLATGREDNVRFQERLGFPSQPRPAGRLIWCHAASVGEAASLLSLIKELLTSHPDYSILVTTGTVTSARLLEKRLPPHVLHQYIPVDRYIYVTRFLDYWHPDFVIWIESELWPNILGAIRQRQIPSVLLNARMSKKSFKHWSYVKSWASSLLSTFNLCLTQTNDEILRFASLGAKSVECVGNLKYAAQPLPFNAEELRILQKSVQDRPVWLAASTHRGEEELILAAHKTLSLAHPNLLTIIVPRHAVRGSEVASMIRASGFTYACRSRHEFITPATAVYLADTMGELGLFYRLASLVVMGGSLVPVGGHNPIEPAQLGSVIVLGPYMNNFKAIADDFIAADAALPLAAPQALVPVLDRLLSSPQERVLKTQAALNLTEHKRQILDEIFKKINPLLILHQKHCA